MELNHKDGLTRYWDSIFTETTTEKVTARRRAVRRSLERIRNGTAAKEETEIIRSCLQVMLSRSEITEENRRMYSLVMHYLAPEPMTARELGRKLNIDNRTVFKDITRAIEQLTVAIYGIDGIVLES